MEGSELIVIQIDLKLLLLAGLMVYRLSYMTAREEGPFGLFAWARGNMNPSQSNWIGRGVNCPLCISFWYSLFVAALFFPGSVPLGWLSLAGLAMLFERVSN